jgi:hypothetical protein
MSKPPHLAPVTFWWAICFPHPARTNAVSSLYGALASSVILHCDELKVIYQQQPTPDLDPGVVGSGEITHLKKRLGELNEELRIIREKFALATSELATAQKSKGGNVDITIEERQINLLVERYWGKGEDGRRMIYRQGQVVCPNPLDGEVNADLMGSHASDLASPYADEHSDQMDETTGDGGADGGADATIRVGWDSMDAAEDVGLAEVVNTTGEASGTTRSAVSYKYLSLGHDFEGFFGRKHSTILVREDYVHVLKHLQDMYHKKKDAVVLTGQPGIGKEPFYSGATLTSSAQGR